MTVSISCGSRFANSVIVCSFLDLVNSTVASACRASKPIYFEAYSLIGGCVPGTSIAVAAGYESSAGGGDMVLPAVRSRCASM